MNISLTNIGKRFNTEWIFRKINFQLNTPGKYAITGPNGSGKSTLLQLIGGFIIPNEGEIIYRQEHKNLSSETIFHEVSLAAPYLDLIEEMTLREFLAFHNQMKGLKKGLSLTDIARYVSLEHALDKQIRYFSSGMKQRAKLAQAFFDPSSILLLDEPLSNLDAEGVSTYYHLIDQFTKDRLVIVSSNDEKEFSFCTNKIDLRDYK